MWMVRTLFGFGWIMVRGRLGSDLVTRLFGWLGISFADSWFTGFVQSAKWMGVVEFGLSAMWSGYSWVYISCATVISSLQTI